MIVRDVGCCCYVFVTVLAGKPLRKRFLLQLQAFGYCGNVFGVPITLDQFRGHPEISHDRETNVAESWLSSPPFVLAKEKLNGILGTRFPQ